MRKQLQVSCKDCGKQFQKRSDTLKYWQGRCVDCAKKEVNLRPEVQAAYRQNGLNFTEKFGSKYLNSCVGPRKKKIRDKVYLLNLEILRKERGSREIMEWARAVKINSNYICECCGKSTKKLEADHILPFSLFPELRLDLNNGRALCKPCHLKYGALVRNKILIKPAYSPVNL